MAKINFLVSYYYWNDRIEKEFNRHDRNKYRLIIDSGAYSAFKLKKEVKLKDYHEFLKKIDYLKPDHCAQLDVIKNFPETKSNYLKSLDSGFDVKPVYTIGSPDSWLDEIKENSDMLFLGGMSVIKRGKGEQFINRFMPMAKDLKVHWFGFDSYQQIMYWSPYSFDSTYASMCISFWRCLIYYGSGKQVIMSKPMLLKKRMKRESGFIKGLSNIGLSMNDLETSDHDDFWLRKNRIDFSDSQQRQNYACLTYLSTVKRMYELEKRKGTLQFLAETDPDRISNYLSCAEYLESRKIIC